MAISFSKPVLDLNAVKILSKSCIEKVFQEILYVGVFCWPTKFEFDTKTRNYSEILLEVAPSRVRQGKVNIFEVFQD